MTAPIVAHVRIGHEPHNIPTCTGKAMAVLRCGFDEPPQGEGKSEHGAKDNKMQRWLDRLRDVAMAVSQLGTKTRVISVMDREADFFELFDEQRRVGGGVDVLVRAKHAHGLDDGAHRVHYVREPFKREPDFGVTSVKYDFAERVARAEEPR